jgi:hypothetical protein
LNQSDLLYRLKTILYVARESQQPCAFRAIASLSPIVNTDSLVLMKAIDALNSLNVEVARSADDALKLLCQQSA